MAFGTFRGRKNCKYNQKLNNLTINFTQRVWAALTKYLSIDSKLKRTQIAGKFSSFTSKKHLSTYLSPSLLQKTI